MIAVEHVLYDYPGVRALDDVNFTIGKGTITALVGPNGAGKTTLLRCLAALEPPHGGRIAIDDVDIFDEPRRTHRLVGYLPDFFGLYDTLSVGQCLTYAAGSQGVESGAIEQAVQKAARAFSIGDLLLRRASDLSRGQRQRLAIAQATVHEPALLLLDEPAAGLDPQARADLSQTLLALAQAGITVVVSSHILTELEDYCTDLLIIDRGKLVEQRSLSATETGELIAIALAKPWPDLARILGATQDVEIVSVTPDVTLCRVAGGAGAATALLKKLVDAGAPVARFGPDRENLQALYSARVARQGGGAA